MNGSPAEVDASTPRRRRFYGWWVVLIGAFVFATAGSGSGLPKISSFLLGDQPEELLGGGGFSYGYVGYLVLRTGLSILLLPFVGAAVDRWGARRVIVWGFATMAGGFALLAASHITPVFYVSLIALVLGGSVASPLPIAAAVNNWFRRRRATAMGVMLLPSVAGLLLTPLLGVTAGIVQAFGSWAAWLVVAAVVLALIWPISKLARNRPEDHGQLPDGVAPVVDSARGSTDGPETFQDYTWREALRTRAFWLITLGIGFNSAASLAGGFYIAGYLADLGFPTLEIGGVLAAMTLAGLIASVVFGMIGDRVPIRWALFGCSFLQVVATCLLLFVVTSPIAFLFAVVMGIGTGGSIPLALAVRGVYFGRRNFATITGISMMTVRAMQSLAPVGMGMIFTFQGSLSALPILTMVVAAVACVLYLLPGDPRPPPSQLRPAEPPYVQP